MALKLSIQYNLPENLMQKCAEISGMELTTDPENADAVLFLHSVKYGPNTHLFQSISAGYDHLSRDDFPKGSTLLCNAGGFNEPVAETVFALILSHTREICAHNTDYHKVEFKRREVLSLYGRTIGIVGYGGIGRKVAEIARVFGMNVIAYTTHPGNESNVKYVKSIREVFENSYIAVLALPLKDETRNVISADLLDVFSGSMIVNIARAEIVHKESMIAFLTSNRDKFYLTDVWWNEPDIEGPIPENAVITPHIGGMGKDFLPVVIDRACTNLRNHVEGRQSHVAFRT